MSVQMNANESSRLSQLLRALSSGRLAAGKKQPKYLKLCRATATISICDQQNFPKKTTGNIGF